MMNTTINSAVDKNNSGMLFKDSESGYESLLNYKIETINKI